MRQATSKDLRSLRGLLERHWKENITNERILEGICKTKKNGSWEYSFGKGHNNFLIFKNIDFGRKIRPLSFNNARANIGIKLGIKLVGDTSDNTDNISELGVSIQVGGSFIQKNTDEVVKVISSWHLDKDVPLEEDKEDRFTHPLYHLNFGGVAMTKTKEDGSHWDFGSLLLMETPRIVHHPMDVVLAVDFILRNFYSEKRHKKITDKKPYKQLLSNACERFLKPYYNSIASKWDDSITVMNLNPSHIMPCLNH